MRRQPHLNLVGATCNWTRRRWRHCLIFTIILLRICCWRCCCYCCYHLTSGICYSVTYVLLRYNGGVSIVRGFHNVSIGVQAIISRAKAKFFGQKPTAKNEKNIFFYLLHKKMQFFLSSELKCPKSGIFANNYWVGWVGQSNFAS